MTFTLTPEQADYLATVIELGSAALGEQSPTETAEQIAKALRDCPNGATIEVAE